MITPPPLPVTCYTEHAFQRAQERYGVTLLPQDMLDILAACLAGEAPTIRHNSVTDIHVVTHKGHRLVVAVRRGALIITFLPANADRTDPRFKEKPRNHDRESTRREPYRRSKFGLSDLRRGRFEEAPT